MKRKWTRTLQIRRRKRFYSDNEARQRRQATKKNEKRKNETVELNICLDFLFRYGNTKRYDHPHWISCAMFNHIGDDDDDALPPLTNTLMCAFLHKIHTNPWLFFRGNKSNSYFPSCCFPIMLFPSVLCVAWRVYIGSCWHPNAARTIRSTLKVPMLRTFKHTNENHLTPLFCSHRKRDRTLAVCEYIGIRTCMYARPSQCACLICMCTAVPFVTPLYSSLLRTIVAATSHFACYFLFLSHNVRVLESTSRNVIAKMYSHTHSSFI